MNKVLLADFPAYAVYRMPELWQEKMIDGMEFVMPFESARYGTQYHSFKIGSVVGYAIKNGDDPMAAVEHAEANGHDLEYVFGLGTSISNQRHEKGEKFALAWGDEIGFHGKRFRLEKAPNQNVRLVPVTE